MEINPIVYIVGAGPGDPGLLTLKAKSIIEKADVIAYDNLISKEILELALNINPRVKLIFIGKVTNNPEISISQEKANNLLLEFSKEYKIICRLKGGDPIVFGRGGEEALFLKENNIDFEIIPGVSSITAVPAYAGIPVTHRDCNSSFTVITAHENPEYFENTINWKSFDALNNTLILLMGVKNLPKIVNKLIELGRNKHTPIAIISSGTLSNQSTLESTLEHCIEKLKETNIKPPATIIIGDVVKYRHKLSWFESKPLFGKKILITRSKDQSQSFKSKLLECGAKVISLPIMNYEIIEKEIYNKNIVNDLQNSDWIFFTSQNAVKFFFEILKKNCYDSRALANIQIAVVGEKTNLELLKYNIKADFIPSRFSLNDLIAELSNKTALTGKNILHPTQTCDAIETYHGMPLQTWQIYKANFIESIPEQVINEIKDGVDILTFFSSNTLIHFSKLIKQHNLNSYIKQSLIAVIGEETKNTANNLFGKTDIIANPSTEDGLLTSIETYFRKDLSYLKQEIR